PDATAAAQLLGAGRLEEAAALSTDATAHQLAAAYEGALALLLQGLAGVTATTAAVLWWLLGKRKGRVLRDAAASDPVQQED
ncbi:hypothetical protein VWX78_22690, partial [Xanthomonas citri pv. citri]